MAVLNDGLGEELGLLTLAEITEGEGEVRMKSEVRANVSVCERRAE